MSQMTARPDPAPSRLKYRMERLMLTPLFRLVLRFGLPCLLTFGIASWWLSVDDNRMKIIDTYADLRSQVESRPEFMVNVMVVDGASEIVSDGIRQMLPLDFPISSFDLDLEVMRETVVSLDPVKSARLYVRQGNVLQVDVVRQRLADEYGVNCKYDQAAVATARWVSCDDPSVMKDFLNKDESRITDDHAGAMVYLANSRVNLQLTLERWPNIRFAATREHGVV